MLLRCDVVVIDLDELVLDLHHRPRREEAGKVVNAVPVEDEIAECWGGGARINKQASFDAFLSPFPLATFDALAVLLLPRIQRRMAGAREDTGYLRIRAT